MPAHATNHAPHTPPAAAESLRNVGKLLLLSAPGRDLIHWDELFSEAALAATSCDDPAEAMRQLRASTFDVVLMCLPIPGWSADEILEEAQRAAPQVPVVVFDTEPAEVSATGRLVRQGAFQCMDATTAREARIDAVRAAVLHRRAQHAAQPDDAEPWRRFLVGRSPALESVIDTVRLIGPRRCTVLITGETGTGKEMVARSIHMAGSRFQHPWVAVNCTALPEQLLEAELFGHVRGAFTGAINHRVGRFEQANRGTLFLDEIGDLPLDLQAKLLRVLQEREFQRLGSSETVKVDVRVIAASNVNLAERVRQGEFREDLYYRINVVPIAMPPLRERPSDIPSLVHHFLEKVCRQEDIPFKQVTPETLERLARFHWPGNVRQLENAVEMASALSGDRRWLYPGDFPLPSSAADRPVLLAMPSRIPLPEEGLDFEQTVGSLERDLLDQALQRTGGNKKLAADLLRLKRTTLAAKLRSYDVREMACQA